MRKFFIGASVCLVLIVVLLVGAEFVARGLLAHRISDAVKKELDAPTSVHLDTGTPVLWQLAHKHLSSVTLQSNDVKIGSLSHVGINLRLDDVHINGTQASSATVADSHAVVIIPAQSLADAVPGGALLSISVKADPASNSLQIKAGPGGLISGTLKPTLEADKLNTVLSDVNLAGRTAPHAIVSELQQHINGLHNLNGLPWSMRATSANVVDNGVQLVLDGGPSTLSS